MKVLHINAVYGVGSTGVIVEDIHKFSMLNGIDSYVAYSKTLRDPDSIVGSYEVGSKFSKKCHAFLCRINGKQAYFSHFATKKLLKHIDKIKPDIVHLHNLHSNYIHLNMLLKYLAKNDISTVLTLHDCWFYTGGCFHYTHDKCDGWLKECGNCPKKKLDTPAKLFDCSAKILRDRKKYFGAIKDLTVVGVSEWITNDGTRTFLKGRRALPIYNGVNTEFFAPTESNIKKALNIEDKFVVLGMSNKWLRAINRDALEYFASNLPPDSVMVIVGCREEQKASLPKNVIGLDYIRNRDTLRQTYSMADVFANCTREESLSLVNVEAQSCGTPVVTYRNTGVQETVNNICGFSVETADYKALFQKVMEIREKGKAVYTEACRDFVKDRFHKETNYQKYVDLYREIYSKKKGQT